MISAGGVEAFLSALTLQSGYNSTLVALGSAMLGAAAGAVGTFLLLRKRALVSDAISHATLPGLCLAFMAMVMLGGDGRWLPGLLIGSALSAGIGLLAVDAMTRHTRLGQDAAIGAVLSVFFGLGVVLLTAIQTMGRGRQAGLEDFLLGSTSGMLRSEALTIGVAALFAAVAAALLLRWMAIVAFDEGFAEATGVGVRRVDLAAMALVLGVTVIGLKVVGLILIVALLIIPPVAARFWTDRVGRMLVISSVIGALSGFLGAAISASGADLPTGPVIVLIAFALFVASLLLSPHRGVVSMALAQGRLRDRVHLRQGLLSLARGEPIYEKLTLRLLRRARYISADGALTLDGRAAVAQAQHDEARWALLRRGGGSGDGYDGLRPIEDVLTPDQITELDARLGHPQVVP